MLENVKDGFVKDILLSPTIDKILLSIALFRVCVGCEKDLENLDLPFEVVDKRADLLGQAMDAYIDGNYGTSRSLLIEYFSV